MKLQLRPNPHFKDLWGFAPYKLSKGGRASGKSWDRCDELIMQLCRDPNRRAACIRETGVSLDESVKVLLEQRMRDHKVDHLFEFQSNRILCRQGEGRVIFKGMANHNADSIRGLEGVTTIWFEEAQNTSARVLEVLLPTIRDDDAEVWFTWNPDDEDAPIEAFAKNPPAGTVVVHSTYLDNPWVPQRSVDLAESHKQSDPDKYNWIWLGDFNKKSDEYVFRGRYKIQAFEPQPHWDGPYFGADWGFSQDPTVLVKAWRADRRLYVEDDVARLEVPMDDISRLFLQVPGVQRHKIRGDNARPETINHLNGRDGLKVVAAAKWPNSVEEGVDWLLSHEEIIVHPNAEQTAHEMSRYRYKTNRAGDVLRDLVDADNHAIDGLRYAFAPLIKKPKEWVLLP